MKNTNTQRQILYNVDEPGENFICGSEIDIYNLTKLYVEDGVPIAYLEGKVDEILCYDPNLVILPFDEFRVISDQGHEEQPVDLFDDSEIGRHQYAISLKKWSERN